MATERSPTFVLNNDIEMPALGFGVFNSAPRETVAAVGAAIAAGYRLIDTAAAYRNEQEVGDAIRRSGIPRDQIFITTKLWMSDYGYEPTLRAFDSSLRKLGLEVLDLYLIHWPLPSAFEVTIGSYKAMIELLSQRRVRAIGVSNFTSKNLEILIGQTGHVPAVNQVELHPFFNQAKLREVHETMGIVTQAWSPIGGVQRYGAKARASGEVRDVLSHSVIVNLSQKYRKSPAQIILRWQLELGNSPIPKSVRPTRIVENIGVFDFKLTSEEVASISALETGERGGWDPDQVNLHTFAES